ncbi:uncharacterized protein LOC126904882 [Daktulosphaira vitifoliae]|uniref:uncharacterized protein LOC126904882 n=1 Tax=Daktulosphaira vitifoliae TaxID=58002 RepID=UPI0021A9D1D9|nr:uncharacterized protein LOC126904882 [Daktulosphaira vitifoliae]
MEFYYFILISTVVFVLKPTEAIQSKTYNKNYRKYIKTVVAYIHTQIGSNQMLNLKLKQDLVTYELAIIGVPDVFTRNYRYTIGVLNYKYTEILKKFLEYMNIIIDKCNQFQKINLSENFICCVTLLVEEIKNSSAMFENLHNAMKFISYIDIKFLFFVGRVMHPIIDEIYFFHQFVKILETNNIVDINIIPNLDDSKTKLENITKFYEDGLQIVNNLFKYSNVTDISKNTDLEKKQTQKCSNDSTIKIVNCSNELNFEIVYSTCSKLNSFYNETIELWYKNLGFEHFLNPKTPDFTPPKDPEINQNDGIDALNILRLENGWQSMKYINIVYYDKRFNVDSILNDKINDVNFRIKRDHVSQLLRCKYTETLKNYQTLLSALLLICKKDSIEYQNNCLIEVFKSFKKSKRMLKGLYNALITLNKSSIWIVNYNSHSSLHRILKWVVYGLTLLKKNNFSQIDFIDQDNNKKMNEIIKELLDIFQKYLNDLCYEINSFTSRYETWCHFTENHVFEKNRIIYFFKTSIITLNNTNITKEIDIYLIACRSFENFCEYVYNSCYENLGFRKINCRNKKLDERLKPFIVD